MIVSLRCRIQRCVHFFCRLPSSPDFLPYFLNLKFVIIVVLKFDNILSKIFFCDSNIVDISEAFHMSNSSQQVYDVGALSVFCLNLENH